jgi:glycosyltransferase involved in cell wall biosynthesis
LNNKLITVVTVVYNAEDLIEETIQSITNQTLFEEVEYIVIDGNSKDNTLEIINRYKDKIDILVSEPDKGIYDAMNKAIGLASGEWINFMNAGDTFTSNSVLEKTFSNDVENYDFIYGKHIWMTESQKVLVDTRPLNLMWQRICFCHQSLFSRTVLMKEKPFDLSYKIVCDYENYFSRYMERKKFLKVDFPIAVFMAGGFSDINFFKRTRERYSVVKKYKNDLEVKRYYINIIVHYYLSKIKKRFKNAK